MRRVWRILLLVLGPAIIPGAGLAQMAPAEWRAAAAALFLHLDSLEAPGGVVAQPRPLGAEISSGYAMARRWRLHNNGNTENILAEYLSFVQLCRVPGCSGDVIGGKSYLAWAQEVRAERARYGSAEAHVQAIHGWLDSIAPAAGENARRNLAWFRRDPDQAAADFATVNIYSLGWIISRSQADPLTQAASFARFGLFVYGRAWIGGGCVDITRIAAVIDGPPVIAVCR